jgi:hypothetical protein
VPDLGSENAMRVFASYTLNGGTAYSAYEGMSQDIVTNLLAGIGATDVVFLTEDQYNAAMPQT